MEPHKTNEGALWGGRFSGGPITVAKGDTFTITIDEVDGEMLETFGAFSWASANIYLKRMPAAPATR